MERLVLIIAVNALLAMIFNGLSEVILQFTDLYKGDLNYYKTQGNYKLMKYKAYVTLFVFLICLGVNSWAIYQLFVLLW